MRILFVGDIVGVSGRNALKRELPELVREHRPDGIIVNGENAAAGKGITRAIANEFFGLGVHAITMGNHTWDQKEIFDFIDQEKRICRPANFPPGTPGSGIVQWSRNGQSITVINLQGKTFLPPIDCPFQKIDQLLSAITSDVIILDFHAEATSEKIAMGWYVDGRVTAMIGTHTHVQTNDARILPQGTAYITDVGMTGSMEGVLGVQKSAVIKKFTTGLPVKFEVDEGKAQFSAVLIHCATTGKATKIEKIYRTESF